MALDVARIRRTWSRVILSRQIVGTIFYSRLFALAPETRALFPASLDSQGRKLVETLGWIVDHIDDAETLLPQARALARRHVAYGVTAEHYPAVGAALLETLQAGLGDAFGEADAVAWREAYAFLSAEMIRAAYPEPAPG